MNSYSFQLLSKFSLAKGAVDSDSLVDIALSGLLAAGVSDQIVGTVSALSGFHQSCFKTVVHWLVPGNFKQDFFTFHINGSIWQIWTEVEARTCYACAQFSLLYPGRIAPDGQICSHKITWTVQGILGLCSRFCNIFRCARLYIFVGFGLVPASCFFCKSIV